MSGVMKPFDTLLGVVINRWSSSRALMLPSLLATKPLAYRRRPTSTISARSCSSLRVLIRRPGGRESLRESKSYDKEGQHFDSRNDSRPPYARDRYSSRHFSEQK